MTHEMANNAGDKIATALGLFASCIKSGAAWSAHCEQTQREAFQALSALVTAVQQAALQELVRGD